MAYSCSEDGSVIVWDVSALQVRRQFRVSCDRLQCIQIHAGMLWCCKSASHTANNAHLYYITTHILATENQFSISTKTYLKHFTYYGLLKFHSLVLGVPNNRSTCMQGQKNFYFLIICIYFDLICSTTHFLNPSIAWRWSAVIGLIGRFNLKQCLWVQCCFVHSR